MDDDKQLQCPDCGGRFPKDALERDCANCFGCTSCEIYRCPSCGSAIVVKPMRQSRLRK